MAEQYISIGAVRDRVARHPLLEGVQQDAVVDYTVDLMRIIGVPEIFENRIYRAHTDDHRVKLPCDYIKMVQMRGRRGVYRYATDVFHLSRANGGGDAPAKCENESPHCGGCHACEEAGEDLVVKYNDPTCVVLRGGINHAPNGGHRHAGNYYVTQGGIIFLSNRTDDVEMSYTAVKTDSDGLPMVPDDAKFLRALTAYIKKEEFTMLFDTGRIGADVLQNAKQEYAWAVGAASVAAHEIDLPRLEALSQAMHGMVHRTSGWETSFSGNAVPMEMIKH